ncbi:MAG: (Fe-S)-binding protein [Candidatus Helarchaeota archaeon]
MTTEILIDMLKCARCGKCRSLCPSFQTGSSKWETTSARGRILLALGLAQNKVPITPQFISDIYSCFMCKYCSELCPSAVNVPHIIETTRNVIYTQNLLPNPIQNLIQNLDTSRNIFNLDQEDRLLWTLNVEEIVDEHLGIKAEVGFFVGCLESFKGTLATIPEAFVRILDHLHINFTLLGEEEWCCGNPYFMAGKTSPSPLEYATHNISKLKALGVKTVVTNCPGCYRVWTSIYPKLLGTVPFKIRHSSQFLAQLLHSKQLKISKSLPKTVVFQDPCELGRHCGEYEAPRLLLEAIPSLRLIELEASRENALCCGGGGLVKAAHPTLAVQQGCNKLQAYLTRAADLLITACPSCYENYQNSLDLSPSKIQIKDLNELIAEQLELV